MNREDLKPLSERASATHEILQAVYDFSDKIDKNQAKSEQSAAEQKRTERIRFWITFTVTLIGSVAAVGGLIATIALR